ncbi:MAG: DUF3617 domain-containing protein [Roseiarcus sp.]
MIRAPRQKTFLLRPSAAAILVLAFAATGARADDPPLRKAGLWEVTVAVHGVDRTMRQCVDDASQTAQFEIAKSKAASACSQHEARRDGNRYIQDSVCNFMGTQRSLHSVTTAVSENEFTSVNTTHFDPPRAGQSEATTSVTGKWLGPCGDDLKPGEMSVDGHKIGMPSQ